MRYKMEGVTFHTFKLELWQEIDLLYDLNASIKQLLAFLLPTDVNCALDCADGRRVYFIVSSKDFFDPNTHFLQLGMTTNMYTSNWLLKFRFFACVIWKFWISSSNLGWGISQVQIEVRVSSWHLLHDQTRLPSWLQIFPRKTLPSPDRIALRVLGFLASFHSCI